MITDLLSPVPQATQTLQPKTQVGVGEKPASSQIKDFEGHLKTDTAAQETPSFPKEGADLLVPELELPLVSAPLGIAIKEAMTAQGPEQALEIPLLEGASLQEGVAEDTAILADVAQIVSKVAPKPSNIAKPKLADDTDGATLALAPNSAFDLQEAPRAQDSALQESDLFPAAPDVAKAARLSASESLAPLTPDATADPQTDGFSTLLDLSEPKSEITFELKPEPTPQTPAPKAPLQPLTRNVLERMETLVLEEGQTKVLLKPQGLGLLEVDMTRAPDGRMNLIIRVENPMVLDALRQESAALSLFMGAKGFDLSGGQPQLAQYSAPKSETAEAEADEALDDPIVVQDQLAADGLNIVT